MKSPLARRMKRLIALTSLCAALLGGGSLAQAELTSSGDLFVTFDGGILPDALPRHTLAPISVKVSGKVRTLSGEHPPALRQISIQLNHNGHLDSRGLPVCLNREVSLLPAAQARAKCAAALVGTGRYIARTYFPEQPSYPTHGKILAFNSTVHGRPAILAHISAVNPVPLVRTFVFRIRREQGTYGTSLTATVPPSLGRFGYLKRISIELHRTYRAHGVERSYLSADCPAPAGLGQAAFKFAHTTTSFADGRSLSATLTRTCRVR